jgi:hypothetical protein
LIDCVSVFPKRATARFFYFKRLGTIEPAWAIAPTSWRVVAQPGFHAEEAA